MFWRVCTASALLLAGVLSTDAHAQGRARVSEDLDRKLSADDGRPTRVIVTGSQARVDALETPTPPEVLSCP